MKNSILIALLGITVAVVTPSLSFADNEYRFGPNKDHNKSYNKGHSKGHANKHMNKNRHVAKAKPPKPHHNRRHNAFTKFNNNKHYKNYGHHKPKTSFSITYGNNLPGLVYGHELPQRHVYKDTHGYKNSIYQRQDNQARRIRKGIKKGQLVRREIRRLREEQRHIDSELAYFKRDGRLNRHERSKLHHMLDIADNNIRNKRHNQLTRYSKRDRHERNYDYAWH